jgi:hypothetical protein
MVAEPVKRREKALPRTLVEQYQRPVDMNS